MQLCPRWYPGPPCPPLWLFMGDIWQLSPGGEIISNQLPYEISIAYKQRDVYRRYDRADNQRRDVLGGWFWGRIWVLRGQ